LCYSWRKPSGRNKWNSRVVSLHIMLVYYHFCYLGMLVCGLLLGCIWLTNNISYQTFLAFSLLLLFVLTSYCSKDLHRAVQTIFVRYVEMTLTYSRKKMSISSHVMIVLFLFAALAMSTSVRRAHKYALGARPGTNATKVRLLFLELV
jgi:hypothetical protein